MQFSCRVERRSDGTWRAEHRGPQVGSVEVTAATKKAALEKLQRELRYRLEYCPCSGELYQDVPIELIEP